MDEHVSQRGGRVSLLLQKGVSRNELTEPEAGYPLYLATKHLYDDIIASFADVFDLLAY